MFSDLSRWIADLGQAASSIESKERAVRDTTKAAIKETAVEIVPVHDGILRDSIEEFEDGVEATAAHAPFVEWGTYKDAPQPFMGPAADQHENAYVEGVADAASDI